MRWWLFPVVAAVACSVPGEPPAFDAGAAEDTLVAHGATRIVWSAERPRWVAGRFAAASADPIAAADAFLAENQRALDVPGELVVSEQREGRGSVWLRYQQEVGGLPVLDGELTVRVADGAITDVGVYPARFAPHDASPALDADAAIAAAASAIDWTLGGEQVPPLATLGWDADGALVWQVLLAPPEEDWELRVDAETGEVRSLWDRIKHVTGTGQVFDPDPVTQTGNTGLKDSNDANSAALSGLYVANVALPNLDGSGFLRGTYVDAQQNARASSATNTFNYTRDDDHFEEVMTYYHLDRVQGRVQSLGFLNVNNRQQVVEVNGTNQDNSWYTPATRKMTTGTGGVDDSEDAEIITHEYGHAIQDDQVPGFGTSNAASAMGEGFGDYLAGSMQLVLAPTLADPACVGDWDATSYSAANPPCLRRLDGKKHYPERWDSSAFADPHANGELWSAGLWNARAVVGADVMDSIVLEHHFGLPKGASIADAVASLEAAALNLYGQATWDDVQRALVSNGLSQHLSTPSPNAVVLANVKVKLQNPLTGGTYPKNEDYTALASKKGAPALRLHFKAVDTEANKDFVYLYDKSGNLYQILSGNQLNFSAVVIPGDTVAIRLVSDGGTQKTGFWVDSVDVMGP